MPTTYTIEQHLSNIDFLELAVDTPASDALVLVFSWKVQEDETTVINYAAAVATAAGCREADKCGVFVPNLEIILEDGRFHMMRSTVAYSVDYVAARVLGLWEDSTGVGDRPTQNVHSCGVGDRPTQNAHFCAKQFLRDLHRTKTVEMTVTAYTEQDQQDD